MPRSSRPLVGQARRGTVFTNFDGSPSYYYNRVQPAAGAAYLQQLNAAQGGGSVSGNPDYYSTAFGRRERNKILGEEAAKQAQQQAIQSYQAQQRAGELRNHFLGAGDNAPSNVAGAALEHELIGSGQGPATWRNPFFEGGGQQVSTAADGQDRQTATRQTGHCNRLDQVGPTQGVEYR